MTTQHIARAAALVACALARIPLSQSRMLTEVIDDALAVVRIASDVARRKLTAREAERAADALLMPYNVAAHVVRCPRRGHVLALAIRYPIMAHTSDGLLRVL